MGEPAPERVVLISVTAYDDDTGEMVVSPAVSDERLAAYLTHLAGVAARGEHREH